MISPLPAAALRRDVDPETFSFKTTAELKPDTRIIGQTRGVQAIAFGSRIQSPGYNIYVLGQSGTGRTTAIQHFIEEQAKTEPVPTDWVYVHNFRDPQQPLALPLPAGQGNRLQSDLESLINRLKVEIAQAFDNQAFRDAALEIQHEIERKREELFSDLSTKALAQGAALVSTPEGFRIVPAAEGQPLDREQLAALTPEAVATWRETQHKLQHHLNETLYQSHKLEQAGQSDLQELVRRVASTGVDVSLTALKESFAEEAAVIDYIDQLHQDILDHVDFFRIEGDAGLAPDEKPPPDYFRRYRVNVLVDHTHSSSAPVIVEYNPTVPRLLGRVEHEARYGGAIVTDFTLLQRGALHEANGGYLIIRARDLFNETGAWEGLKRALVGAAIKPDDPAIRGGAATRSLDPAPIPLRVKVILVGPPELYYYLYDGDDDFNAVFKVMADFDEVVERSTENEIEYATFVASRCHEENLLHFNQAAVARVIEYGSRLAGTQRKLSTRFGHIADLVREADYWARHAEQSLVRLEDVVKAIATRRYRGNRIESRLREQLLTGKKLLATKGDVVGQINGLSVSQIGEHAFGQPGRVTARTYVGKEGVVQIDRAVDLAGPLHNKGVLTLIGYLGGHYASEQPLSFSAQITFEQNYGGIDGDSASSTELYALLSSLSGIPISQAMAVTGSVNQLGEVQAIGGVTQKVEGWYEACQQRGLTGNQGVLVPASNVADLMLSDYIVKDVAAGKFHVWAVASIDDGIALLTGRSAADVHAAVKARLASLVQSYRAFRQD